MKARKPKPISLPQGWRERLRQIYQWKWRYQNEVEFLADSPTLSRKTLDRAEKSGDMTGKTFDILVRKSGHQTRDELLTALQASSSLHALSRRAPGVRSAEAGRPVSANPAATVLTTKKETPQWTDYRELKLGGERLRLLTCKVVTESIYFRFGFKLLTQNGQLFGDASIQSQDTNLLVHIGRNKTSRDVFLTSYRNGIREDYDKVLFTSPLRLEASVDFSVDEHFRLVLSVNGTARYERIVPPEICDRVVMLAWGDHDDFAVKVANLTVTTRR